MNEKERNNWSNFEPYCILRFVLRYFWLVILTALTCFMSVYLVQRLAATPVYTSTVTFAVTARSTAGNATNTLAVTDTVAGKFGQLLSSDILQKASAKRMGLDHFPATVSVNVPEKTNILIMSVTADSPELAYKSALAVMECHTTYAETIFASAVLDNINGPTIPQVPSNASSRTRVLQLSGPAGAIAMIILLVMQSMQADTIQTVAGAKRQIDGKLLVTISHERKNRTLRTVLSRKKKSLLITNPTCSFYYTETIHQLRVFLEHAREKDGRQIFLVTSCTENEGKSTIAANLALSLAQKDKRVLLLDADLRKPAQALIFETRIPSGKDFSSLLTGGFTPEAIDDAIVHAESTGLYTLYSDVLRRWKTNAFSQKTLRPLLDHLRRRFNYIIIDTAPLSLFADAEVIADAADASLLVVRQDLVPAIAVNDAIDTLNEANAEFLGCVLNNLHSIRGEVLLGSQYGTGYSYGYGYGYGYSRRYGYGKKKSASGKEELPNE